MQGDWRRVAVVVGLALIVAGLVLHVAFGMQGTITLRALADVPGDGTIWTEEGAREARPVLGDGVTMHARFVTEAGFDGVNQFGEIVPAYVIADDTYVFPEWVPKAGTAIDLGSWYLIAWDWDPDQGLYVERAPVKAPLQPWQYQAAYIAGVFALGLGGLAAVFCPSPASASAPRDPEAGLPALDDKGRPWDIRRR